MGKDLFNDRIGRFSIRKLNVGVCLVLRPTCHGWDKNKSVEERQIRQVKVQRPVATASGASDINSYFSKDQQAETMSTAPNN